MINDGTLMTRKEQQRAEFEEHFYATWPAYLDSLSYDQLDRMNREKLADVNASYPDTMLWLKHDVLRRMAEFESVDEVSK